MADVEQAENSPINALIEGVQLTMRDLLNTFSRHGMKPLAPQAGEETWRRDPQLYLQATTRPGAKIPHAWLVNERGVRVSTLDVTGKGKFSLVTGIAGQAWVRAAQALNLPFLRTVVTGERGTADPYCNWQRVREIDEAGALLVRPDGYIAWRQSAAVWDDDEALRQLSAAIDAVLDRSAA